MEKHIISTTGDLSELSGFANKDELTLEEQDQLKYAAELISSTHNNYVEGQNNLQELDDLEYVAEIGAIKRISSMHIDGGSDADIVEKYLGLYEHHTEIQYNEQDSPQYKSVKNFAESVSKTIKYFNISDDSLEIAYDKDTSELLTKKIDDDDLER